MRTLRPSMHAAACALADELTVLEASGERVVELHSSTHDGEICIATDTEHEHGITVFGFTDDEEG